MMKSKYAKYLVSKPVYETGPRNTTGRQSPTMTYMSNDIVPGSNVYLEFGWIWDMPRPNPHIPEHTHEYDEIVLHIGSDPNHPEDLGGEIEYMMGGEPLVFDTTSALFVPRGVMHGPITWKKVTRPHIEMAIILGGGTLEQTISGFRKRQEGKI